MAKKICEVCKGNGFVRVPYEIAREEQWADCSFCNNQGEIETHEEDKDGKHLKIETLREPVEIIAHAPIRTTQYVINIPDWLIIK